MERVEDILRNKIGVASLDDLIEVFNDSYLINTVQKEISILDYRRLLNAIKNSPYISVPLQQQTDESVWKINAESAAQSLVEKDAIEVKKHQQATNEINELKSQLASLQNFDLKKEKGIQKEVQKRIKSINDKKMAIDALIPILEKASTVDLAIVLDCTGSMRKSLDGIKNQISQLIVNLSSFYPSIQFRLAFVGYSDYKDPKNFVIQPFIENMKEYQKFLMSQLSRSGRGAFADVLGALNVVASKLNWESTSRVLFHICDEPCAGQRFGRSLDSDCDPSGPSAEKVLRALVEKNISYFFGRIQGNTDKMINVFNFDILKRSKEDEYIKTVDVTDSKLILSEMTKSIASVMTISVSYSVTTNFQIEMSSIPIDTREPIWTLIANKQVLRYPVKKQGDFQSVLNYDNESVVSINIAAAPILSTMKVAVAPFAKGSSRLAFKAKEVRTNKEYIHKVLASCHSVDVTREKYESSILSCSFIASCLKREFDKVFPQSKGRPHIRFCEVSLIQYSSEKGYPFATQEEVLKGEWMKFNSNSGYVYLNPNSSGVDHSIIQTFSHWTLEVTKRKMMVVDCQGVYFKTNNGFILTDPAVHCEDPTLFGGTNLCKHGMERFLKTHVCNQYCVHLGIAIQPSRVEKISDPSCSSTGIKYMPLPKSIDKINPLH